MNDLKEQTNAITKEAYTGHNIVSLIAKKEREVYQANEWITFVQARANGRRIKKGEKALMLRTFFEDKSRKDIDIKKVSEITTRPYYFSVFNIDQTTEIKTKR